MYVAHKVNIFSGEMMSIVVEKSTHLLLAEPFIFLLGVAEWKRGKAREKERKSQNQETFKLFIPVPLILIEFRCYKWHLDAI